MHTNGIATEWPSPITGPLFEAACRRRTVMPKTFTHMTAPTHVELWEKFLAILADNLLPEQYDAWFKPITSLSFVDNKLTVNVPSHFFSEQIEERYGSIMKAALIRVYGKDVQLFYHYLQVGNLSDTAVNVRSTNPSGAVKPAPDSSSNPFNRRRDIRQEIDPQLNPRYTFENYCGSISNKVARSIGEAIATDPRCRTFNPLFIFGPSGVGKTHLIQAIGIRIKETRHDTRVLYITARLFESQFTQANIDGKINDFIYFYQSIDVLIIDDIQDLLGKKKTQNAFFHIFNHLIQNQKQIIMSSDCRPANMDGMDARLISRFKSGMTAELERPDLELRRSVLRLKAEQDGVTFSDDIIDFIAANVTESIRELEGVVVSLEAYAIALNREIDVDLARTVIGNAVKFTKRQVNFELIADVVSSYYNIDTDRIFTKTRKREVSDARQIVMYLAKKHTSMPLKAIGLRLDRTHATVLYACKTTEERIAIDKQLHDDITSIENTLFAG